MTAPPLSPPADKQRGWRIFAAAVATLFAAMTKEALRQISGVAEGTGVAGASPSRREAQAGRGELIMPRPPLAEMSLWLGYDGSTPPPRRGRGRTKPALRWIVWAILGVARGVGWLVVISGGIVVLVGAAILAICEDT